ncbi:2-nitropropane dioxygenase [Corynebacterium sp. NML 150383]|uniref:nitronate monooxygenase n=1 Tax=unclassified Corynebacterium TaxID=2624378 RepID=UPI000BAA7448|nr:MULTISPECIES: nitronate monooxygenase [unclassified Corynebacterium]PAT04826.1 2-nitropropane dioxygenase [Corynebacterium sp. NML 150383]TVX80347.1 nitronate monooxygenase [Corynebacterium sp. NML180780]
MDLPRIVAAPMAGGPTTPALVNAVSFGFLALGTCTVEQARTWLGQCTPPFGVNLFVPQVEPSLIDVELIASELGTDVPNVDVTGGFEEKFELVLEAAPPIVSSTFGPLDPEHVERLHSVGSEAWVTVTRIEDAWEAMGESWNADGVIVQGPEAGGHRSTWSPLEVPDTRYLDTIVEEVAEFGAPFIAAGGVRGPEDVARLRDLGASTIACGTAFLLSDEAGTSQRNRELLRTDRRTVVSKAFSGRWARGLENEMTKRYRDMPPIYPYLRPMTKDQDYCLVGKDRGELMEAPAKEIERYLLGER